MSAGAPPLIANARMYALDATVAAAWRTLFEWIGARAEVPLVVVDHPAPAPLAELWQRHDLGSAMMCGYPWAMWNDAATRPFPLAVPIPSPRRFRARPFYWTDIVVRADSRFATAADLAGTRFAFTIEDSQSGYQAPRAFFARAARAAGGRLFSATVGPLVTPRRVVEAVLAGDADAGPLDAWWHDLLLRHDPATASQLRTVAATPPTPMPLLVASAGVDGASRARIQSALREAAASADLRSQRDVLLLAGFVPVEPADYASLATRSQAIDALGYTRLQ